MRHWSGTLHNATSRFAASFNHSSRPRFPTNLLTWRNIGQGQDVKDIDVELGRSPLMVAGISAVFVCCTMAVTVAVGVFCRKLNIVFPLSELDTDDLSKNIGHYDDDDESPGSLQLSTPQSPHFDDVTSVSVNDNLLPVMSAHVQNDVLCYSEEIIQREEISEVQSTREYSVQVGLNDTRNNNNSPSLNYCSNPNPNRMLSRIRQPQLLASLGHIFCDVINSRWIHRRVPAASVDQSAASNVDLTSLLPTL